MEAISIQLKILAVVAVIGALAETYWPGLFSEATKNKLSAITLAFIGVLLSFLLLMFILKVNIREGFEDYPYTQRWRQWMDKSRAEDVCKIYLELYDKMVTVEKGPPQDQKTDAQARENVEKIFAKVMTLPAVSCSKIDELQKANTLDLFYEAIQTASDKLFAQIYDTAIGCRSLMEENYNKIKEAGEKKEGFADICNAEQAKQKRELQQTQDCILAEDIQPDQKVSSIDKKLTTMEETYNTYRQQNSQLQDSIDKILEDCKFYKEEIEKKKNEALALSNKYNLR